MAVQKKAGRKTIISIAIILVLIPLVLVLGVKLGDRNYAVTSTIVVLLSLAMFFLAFERRRVQARELVVVASMAAIAVVSRIIFAPIPQVKPILAVIIVTGAALGAQVGFMSGAVAMLVSNFFFTQGPWTPWQMLCLGLIGFLAGLLYRLPMMQNRVVLCVFGFLSGFLYGFIADIWTILSMSEAITVSLILGVYAQAFYFNLTLAISTAVFLLLVGKPMIGKLERIKVKYGILDL